MKKKLPYLLLAVPVLIALVLGYAIYNQIREDNPSPPQNDQQTEQTSSPETNRTPEEQELLNVPGENASEEERQNHLENVLEVAKNADTLNLSKCTPDIFALRVKQGGKFTVENDDTQEHIMVFNQEHSYKIPANGDTEITVNFGRGAGIYGYGCDRSGKAVGFVVVSE